MTARLAHSSSQRYVNWESQKKIWFTISTRHGRPCIVIGETVRIIEAEKEIKNYWLKRPSARAEQTMTFAERFIRALDRTKNVSVEADESWSTANAWIHMRDGIAVARNKYCHWQIVFAIGCEAFAALRLYSHENAFLFCSLAATSMGLGFTPTIENYYYLLFGRFSLNDFSFWRNKIRRRRFVGALYCCWCVGGRTGRGTSTFWTLTTIIKLVTERWEGNRLTQLTYRGIVMPNNETENETRILPAIKNRKTV